jgi:hypothetical protein
MGTSVVLQAADQFAEPFQWPSWALWASSAFSAGPELVGKLVSTLQTTQRSFLGSDSCKTGLPLRSTGSCIIEGPTLP